jgi:hypothetical protein
MYGFTGGAPLLRSAVCVSGHFNGEKNQATKISMEIIITTFLQPIIR